MKIRMAPRPVKLTKLWGYFFDAGQKNLIEKENKKVLALLLMTVGTVNVEYNITHQTWQRDANLCIYCLRGSSTLSAGSQRSPCILSSLDLTLCGNPSHMAPTYISSAEPLNGAVK